MTEQNDLASKLSTVKESFMKDKRFDLAKAELLKLRQQYTDNIKLVQQLVVCTYKDQEVSPAARYTEALQMLESIGLGQSDCDPETLRLGGAIYKRKWQFDGRLENLYQAYSLYREAADNDPQDYGYGAVNAAFILDLLSARARVRATKTGTSLAQANQLSLDARTLRENYLTKMQQALVDNPELATNTWFSPTYAELYFGLGIYDEKNYDIARDYLLKTVNNGLHEWESETSFRQLVAIAKAQAIQLPGNLVEESNWHPAWKVMTAYLGENTRQALQCYRGRVGLALSGGGFRASFYHIGVLARLAEMDALKSVEVISSVSGGSIVGAHYYLEVQNLLKTKLDADIDKEDYIRIVERVQKQFFAGVSKNLRMRTFANPVANVAMLFNEKHSRSHRIGKLYERDLYSNIGIDQASTDCELHQRNMSDLLITPKDSAGKSFNPNSDNWRRAARAPVILLNTTSLNSGHNWRFTAKWMGEPPGVQDDKIDKNNRYQWVEYGKKGVPHIELGSAVAASACVPGLFEPLEISEVYQGHTVKLVDGGVHDNQGVAGLLDEGCTLILCSDASGQMGSLSNPGSSMLGVPLRSNGILMDRVRESQYQNLEARVDSKALEGLFFTHLKDDLEVEHVRHNSYGNTANGNQQEKTGYGIHPLIQQKIAALRTDLDCFSEIEASALMLSGYKMTEWHFENLQKEHIASGEAGNWGDFDVSAESRGDLWSFLDEDLVRIAAEEPTEKNQASKQLDEQLDIGASLFLKVFKAVLPLKVIGLTVVLAMLVVLGWAIYHNWSFKLIDITVGQITLAAAVLLVTTFWPVFKMLNPQSVVQNKVWMFFLGIGGAAVSSFQVWGLDRFFLAYGKLKELKK